METSQQDHLQELIYTQLLALQKFQVALQKDEFTMPAEVVHARRQLAHHSLMMERKPFVGLNEWAAAMLQPAEKWLPEAEVLFDPAAPLWENDGWSREAEEFMQAFGNPEEYQEQTVAKVVTYCREFQQQEGDLYQEAYVRFRSFLSDPERAVVSEEELNKMAKAFSDEFLKRQLRACYEPFPDWKEARKCPYCGWSLHHHKGMWRCGRTNVCFQLEEKFSWSLQTASPFNFAEGTHVYRLRPGIQRYTLIPGIPEHRIAAKLAATYPVELYPEVDRFDIGIRLADQVHYVDVKCFRRSTHLATYIEQLSDEGLETFRTHACFVIPDEYAREGYIQHIQSRIKKLGVKVYRERDFYRCLRRGELL